MSVVDFWEKRYLPFITEQARPSTANGYRNMWKRYLKHRLAPSLRDFRTAEHSDVGVTRQAYIRNDAIDPRSLAAMKALDDAINE